MPALHTNKSNVSAKHHHGALLPVRVAAVLACAMAVLLLCCSCRPTDFFTEVIISPYADEVDYDNPEKMVVNSPDAEEESAQLAALDWSEGAQQSAEVQNIVAYSSNPTSTLDTHHSLYDLNPRFIGMESSDAVQLDYSQSSIIESETNTEQPTETDYSAEETPLEGSQAQEQGTEEQTGPSDAGEDEEQNDTQGKGDDKTPESDPYAGLDGTVNIYDPNNALAEIPKADHVAATGQAAVMVQALGGRGALCAMDRATYSGTGSKSGPVSTFATVFADDVASDFAQTAIQWENAGTSPADVIDIDALVAACGQGGVIVYDQNQGSPEDRFNQDQRIRLQAANITFVPVSFTTVQGMIDAAYLIGKVLSESSCAEPAGDNATAYNDFISDTVDDVVGNSAGSLATPYDSVTKVLTEYNEFNPDFATTGIFCAFGTEYVTGIRYNGVDAIDTEKGLLFTEINNTSPLAFWAQAAGVWDLAADYYGTKTSQYAVLYGISHDNNSDESTVISRLSSVKGSSILANSDRALLLQTEDNTPGQVSASYDGDGLGSKGFPYLVVAGSGGNSASDVQKWVVGQMDSDSPINAYSILPFMVKRDGITSNSGPGAPVTAADGHSSYIGSVIGSQKDQQESAFLTQDGLGGTVTGTKVSAAQTVRANPQGLLGSWTDGSMESVLEAAWLARIYSDVPENSNYNPVSNYSAAHLQETVQKFYSTFYRYDISAADYDAVVPDKGL